MVNDGECAEVFKIESRYYTFENLHNICSFKFAQYLFDDRPQKLLANHYRNYKSQWVTMERNKLDFECTQM